MGHVYQSHYEKNINALILEVTYFFFTIGITIGKNSKIPKDLFGVIKFIIMSSYSVNIKRRIKMPVAAVILAYAAIKSIIFNRLNKKYTTSQNVHLYSVGIVLIAVLNYFNFSQE